MKKIVLIFAIICLVVMIGALYRAGLGLAEEDPAPGAPEQTLLAASAAAGPAKHEKDSRGPGVPGFK